MAGLLVFCCTRNDGYQINSKMTSIRVILFTDCVVDSISNILPVFLKPFISSKTSHTEHESSPRISQCNKNWHGTIQVFQISSLQLLVGGFVNERSGHGSKWLRRIVEVIPPTNSASLETMDGVMLYIMRYHDLAHR